MPKRLLLLLLLLCIFSSNACLSQNQPSKKALRQLEIAENLYYDKIYDEALTQIDKCLRIDSLYRDALMLKAYVLLELEDYCSAAEYMYAANKILYMPNEKPFLKIGYCYFSCGQFAQAKHFLEKHKNDGIESAADYRFVDSLLNVISVAEILLNNPLDINLVSLKGAINSPHDEFVNAISSDNKWLIFTRRVTDSALVAGDFYVHKTLEETVFFAQMDDTTSNVFPAGDVAPELEYCSAVTLSPDGNLLLFAACNNNDGLGSCDIYCSERNGEKWSKPFNLGSPVNTRYWESQPCMSSDGKTLFFVSNRPGGFGKSDIWYAIRDENGDFSNAYNLGNRINTNRDEFTPFIHFDAHTLYFSSDGHPGLGDLDLFKVDLNGDTEDKPENLGYPINDKNAQQCFIVSPDGHIGYISSAFGKNNFDIYSFEIPEQIRPSSTVCVDGVVVDAVTQMPLKALVEMNSADAENFYSINTSDDGKFKLCLKEDEYFGITVSCEGYMMFSENNISTAETEKVRNIRLSPLSTTKEFVARNIVFALDSYQLESSSFLELDRIVKFIKLNGGYNFEVRGYTDNTGTVEHNMTLSKNRARAVYEYLIGKGIPATRLSYKGYGQENPVATNDTEDGRAANRRTEFIIL